MKSKKTVFIAIKSYTNAVGKDSYYWTLHDGKDEVDITSYKDYKSYNGAVLACKRYATKMRIKLG